MVRRASTASQKSLNFFTRSEFLTQLAPRLSRLIPKSRHFGIAVCVGGGGSMLMGFFGETGFHPLPLRSCTPRTLCLLETHPPNIPAPHYLHILPTANPISPNFSLPYYSLPSSSSSSPSSQKSPDQQRPVTVHCSSRTFLITSIINVLYCQQWCSCPAARVVDGDSRDA